MPAFRDVRRLTALAGFRLLWEVSRRYDFTRDKQIPQSLSPAHPITKQHETRHKLVTVMVRRCVEAIPRGHASFEERFPGKRRRLDDGLPPIAPWRSNLTALSQEHNLYFVAYGTDIYVYQPEFPEQKPRDPVLILPSQPSSADLRGYLDRDEPHAINYLIVHKLGNDEVIATVRDDGDVEVLLVRHLVGAIATRLTSSNDTKEPIADNVKPIFQKNVGISAWGLAIHAQARILAVSSNRHEVTIFRFGLVDQVQPSNSSRRTRKAKLDPQSGEAEPEGDDAAEPRQERKTDVTRQVLNGEANIPHIAFCNTGDDPDGRWLLTTDISGVCRAIDLHRFTLVQAFRFGPALAATPIGGSYDRMNAGWGIMFLDTRSFVPYSTFGEALGLEHDQVLPDAKTDSRIWDLTKTTRQLPDLSSAFKERKLQRPRISSGAVSHSTTGMSSGASSPLEDQAALASNITATLAGVLEQTAPEDVNEEDADDDDAGVALEDTSMSEHAEPDSEVLSEPPGEETDSSDLEMWSDLEDSEGENTEDFIHPAAFYSGERICGNAPQFVRPTNLCEDLPCPVLHASIRNIYLLQPSNQRVSSGTPFLPPMSGMATPLKQSIQAEYRGLNMFDRLSMHAYIPTLGVVIIASQKGRAIVLSLARVSQSTTYPDDVDPTVGAKTNYTLRAECVLPLESQEREGHRPFSPLHGIAVGPIQGTEHLKDDGSRRWRLMMMYQDHSILSYEIRRREDADVDVQGSFSGCG